jgi:hypothetical protein
MLVTEPLEDPAARVPLPPGRLLVILEDLVDGGQEMIEPRLGPRCFAAVARGFRMLLDRLERVPVNAVLTAGSALAEVLDEDTSADLGPILRIGVQP